MLLPFVVNTSCIYISDSYPERLYPPKTSGAASNPTMTLPSPLKWESGGITPGKYLNTDNHFGAF